MAINKTESMPLCLLWALMNCTTLLTPLTLLSLLSLLTLLVHCHICLIIQKTKLAIWLNGLWSKNQDWMEWVSGVDTISTTMDGYQSTFCAKRLLEKSDDTQHIPSVYQHMYSHILPPCGKMLICQNVLMAQQ